MFTQLIQFFIKICCCLPEEDNDSHPSNTKPAIQQPIVVNKTPTLREESSNTKLGIDEKKQVITKPAEIKNQPFSTSSIPFKRIRCKFNRSTTDYKRNITAGLEMVKDVEKIGDDYSQLFQASKTLIHENAARRVDLYFYLLVAVYNTKLQLAQGRTILQHGKGRKIKEKKGLTQACHSSLFPTIISTESTEDEMIVLLLGSHFMDSLNSTVELPLFANQFDSEIEGKISNPSFFRKKSMDILQKVSNGETDPIVGFALYLDEMSTTLDLLQASKHIKSGGKPYLLRPTNGLPKHIKTKMIDHTRIGAFCTGGSHQRDITDEYICLLLRLTQKEIVESQESDSMKSKLYSEKIAFIQNEIHTSTSAYRARLA